MEEKIIKRNNCTDPSLFNQNNLGGHIEDYMSDPLQPFLYTKNTQWVPVSQSFKKD
jgi:hypothetical protein